MDTPLVDTQIATRHGRGQLPALTKWTLATMAAIVVLLIYPQVAERSFNSL